MTAPASAVSTATTVETRAAGPARRRRRRWTRFILPVYSWLVIAYLVLPIGVMVLYSFNRVTTGLPQVSFAWNGFTLQWYREWSNVPGLTSSFWLSVRLAIASTILSTLIGTLLALALVRYRPPRFRGKGLVEQVMFLNIAAPEIVLGASLLGLFVTINLARGFITLLLAHVAFSIAYVAITVRARMSGFDRSLEEAAQDLGANAWTTFRKITLPLIMPGVVGAAMLSFSLSFDDFIVTNFNSGSVVTFPMFVWGAAKKALPPQINVVGTAMLVIALALTITGRLISERRAK